MIFKSQNFSFRNRPKVQNQPVLGLFLIGIILTIFLFLTHVSVQANNVQTSQNSTATPISNFQVPLSGEPIFLQPGNNAQLISPLKIQLLTKPGDDGLVRIELIGQDNRFIFRKLLDYRSYKNKNLIIEQSIPFEIRDDETARLQVVLEDGKGRLTFLTSINLTLLGIRGRESAGELPINPRFLIQEPDGSKIIKGQSLPIAFGIKPINKAPVNVELIAQDGRTISSRMVPITIPNDQTAFAFVQTELPFKVSSPSQITIRIRQESNTLIKGIVLLWSSKLTVSP